jgi:hypothetical protein
MGLPAVPTTNIGIYNHLRESTDCNETTDLSLASLCNGGSFNGIDNSFGGAGGPASGFDLIGGTNNPLTTTADSTNLFDDDIGTAPFNLANCIGGKYT